MSETTRPDKVCPRCGNPLKLGKAIFSRHELLRGAMLEDEAKPPALQDCLKCEACGYSETLTPQS
jgi:hypothetical protein